MPTGPGPKLGIPFPFPLGLGTDICQISRVARILRGEHGQRFVRRVLAPDEQRNVAVTAIVSDPELRAILGPPRPVYPKRLPGIPLARGAKRERIGANLGLLSLQHTMDKEVEVERQEEAAFRTMQMMHAKVGQAELGVREDERSPDEAWQVLEAAAGGKRKQRDPPSQQDWLREQWQRIKDDGEGGRGKKDKSGGMREDREGGGRNDYKEAAAERGRAEEEEEEGDAPIPEEEPDSAWLERRAGIGVPVENEPAAGRRSIEVEEPGEQTRSGEGGKGMEHEEGPDLRDDLQQRPGTGHGQSIGSRLIDKKSQQQGPEGERRRLDENREERIGPESREGLDPVQPDLPAREAATQPTPSAEQEGRETLEQKPEPASCVRTSEGSDELHPTEATRTAPPPDVAEPAPEREDTGSQDAEKTGAVDGESETDASRSGKVGSGGSGGGNSTSADQVLLLGGEEPAEATPSSSSSSSTSQSSATSASPTSPPIDIQTQFPPEPMPEPLNANSEGRKSCGTSATMGTAQTQASPAPDTSRQEQGPNTPDPEPQMSEEEAAIRALRGKAHSLLLQAATFMAGRFAAKEAVMKATSLRLGFHDIIIHRHVFQTPSDNGSALVYKRGAPVAVIRTGVGGQQALLSISHDGDFATAVCLAYTPHKTPER